MSGPPGRYVDGGPCSAGCGRTYWRRGKTARGLCHTCYRYGGNPPSREPFPCACGCGEMVEKTAANKRFLNRKHKREHREAKRAGLQSPRAEKAKRHPNTVLIWELRAEMDAAGKAGRCIYCERRLSPPRVHICADPVCQRMYGADWRRGRAMLKRGAT